MSKSSRALFAIFALAIAAACAPKAQEPVMYEQAQPIIQDEPTDKYGKY